jgi:ribonuclease PH
MNIVMNGLGEFIEVQGTAEGRAFKKTELDKMLTLAELGIQEIIMLQKKAFEQYK